MPLQYTHTELNKGGAMRLVPATATGKRLVNHFLSHLRGPYYPSRETQISQENGLVQDTLR